MLLVISAFSQSEIWGVKYHAGAKNGGVLFSIDSATSQIITHHRFENPNYQTNGALMPPFYDEEEELWLIAESDRILIYHPTIDLIESIDYGANKSEYAHIRGRIHKGNSQKYYILNQYGILQIDLFTKEIKLIENQYDYSYPDRGADFCQVGQKLYWMQQSYNSTELLILSLDLGNDSIELLFHREQEIDLYGKLNYLNGKLYGTYESDVTTIFSFNPTNRSFVVEKEIPREVFRCTTGLQLANNQKLYFGGLDGSYVFNKQLASYNPANDNFAICANYLDYFGQNMSSSFFAFDDEGFYLQFSGTGQVTANILRYTFDSDTLIEVIPNNIYGNFTSHEPNKVFTIQIKSTHPSGQYLFDYNLLTGEVDTLKKLTTPKFEDGMYPGKIIQIENGFIIGKTDRGGIFSGIYYDYVNNSKGVIFQFDPELKKYKVLIDIHSIFRKYESPDIFKDVGNHFLLQLRNIYNNKDYHLFRVNAETLQIDSIGVMPKGTCYQESATEFYIFDKDFLIKYHTSGEYDTLFHFDEFELLQILKSNSEYLVLETWHREDYDHYEFQIQKFYLDGNRLVLDKILNMPKEYDDGDPCRIARVMMTADSNLVGIIGEYTGETRHSRLVKYNMNNDEIQTLRRISTQGPGDYNYSLDLIFHDDYYQTGNVFSLNFRSPGNNGRLDLLDFENDTILFCDVMEEMTIGYDCEESSCGYKYMTLFRPTAKSFMWTGKVSTDWFTADNWQFSQVPDTNSSVYIKGLTPYDPVIDTVVKTNRLIINEDAKLIINENGSLSCKNLINSGKILVQGNENSRASLILSQASDTSGTEIYSYHQHQFINQVFSVPSKMNAIYENDQFQLLNYSDGGWNTVSDFPYSHPPSSALDIFSNDSSFVFYGPFNFENKSLQIPQLNQPTLYPLPNPYPSSINWNKVNLSSLTHKAFYYFNEKDSSFSAYVDGLGTHSSLIRPLDAFWVWSSGAEGVQLDQTAKVHEAEFDYESNNKTFVSLQVVGAKGQDETIIGFNEQASFEFDPEFDAFKFVKTTQQAPHIFTKADENLLSVNQLPDTAALDLFVLAGYNGRFNIHLDEKNNIDFLVLEDLIWNTRTDLLQDDYSFDYFESDGQYPFKLYFEPWALEPLEDVDINMYYYPEFLVVNSRKQVDYAEITFYDLAGRAALEFQESHFIHLQKAINLPGGHYIVQFRSGEVVLNRKVLVR